jgi:DNA adenine methylase
MQDLTSPLRYPGSKSFLADYFEKVIEEAALAGCHFYEPCAGGASLSLCLLTRRVVTRVTLVERDPLIYAFWRCVVTRPDDLCERIEQLRVNVSTWRRFQPFLAPNALREYDLLDLGVAGLFFNRANFSGIIGAKPIGGMKQRSEYKIDCRFNRERLIAAICRIARFRDRITVRFGDAVAFLRQRHEKIASEHALVYVDPPYFKQGPNLYRYHYTLGQHVELAEFMNQSRFRYWIVSYDDHPFIRNNFSGQKIVPIFLNYAVKQSRKAVELLIANFPLKRPTFEDASGKSFLTDGEDLEDVSAGRLRLCR